MHVFLSKGNCENLSEQEIVTLQDVKELMMGASPVKEIFSYFIPLTDSTFVIPRRAMIGSWRYFRLRMFGITIFGKGDHITDWYSVVRGGSSMSDLPGLKDALMRSSLHNIRTISSKVISFFLSSTFATFLSPLGHLESSRSWITKQQSNFHICL